MSSAIVDFVARELTKLRVQKAIAEALSGLPANSEQSIVGPPKRNESENPALARPATLAEVVSWLNEQIESSKIDRRCNDDYWTGVRDIATLTLQRLNELDQGPIAKRLSEQKNHKSVKDYIDSLTVY